MEIKIKVAKIEEHQKNLNGSVSRHENNINELYHKSNQNTLAMGKITAIATLIASVVGTFAVWIINKIWR